MFFSFFFLLQPPHRYSPGSCSLLFTFFFLTLSGLVSYVKGNATVSSFFAFLSPATSLVFSSLPLLCHIVSVHFSSSVISLLILSRCGSILSSELAMQTNYFLFVLSLIHYIGVLLLCHMNFWSFVSVQKK